MAVLRDVLHEAHQLLADANKGRTPYLDALLIASHVLQMPKERTLAMLPDHISKTQEQEIRELVLYRSRGIPVAYLTGVKEFWGLEFLVTPDVLIPRPDTEVLVERSLMLLKRFSSPRVLDLGTGSGCIGISIKHELPQAQVICSDISSRALAVCRKNARRILGSEEMVEIISSDMFEEIPGLFDLIVSNPPYITREEMTSESLLCRGEPENALLGGEDGLDALKKIVFQGFDKLKENSYCICECATVQADTLAGIMQQRGYRHISVISDLSGNARAVLGARDG